MALWGKKKVKEVERTPKQILDIGQVKTRHQHRIDNLLDESEILNDELKTIERDEDMLKSKKAKASDTIIQRLTFIKYELDIRENLVSWL